MTFQKGQQLEIDPKVIGKYFDILNQFTIFDNEHLKQLVNKHQKEDRYGDILPYKKNFVQFSNIRYINASFIHIPTQYNIIATQAPKKETINDFWEMIFFYDCKIIIQLCNLNENGKEKCSDYININLNYDYKTTKINLRWQDKNFQINELKVLNKKINKEKKVYHIFFNNWNDHGIPSVQNSLSSFLLIFDIINKKKNNKPFVVHCSAGVGRTGCFIAIYLLHYILKDKLNDQIIQFNIFNLVRKLREMRLHLIQNFDQFYFIYRFIKFYLENNKLQKFNIEFLE